MGYYTGKIAFITGASSGIGAALARELAKRGADVAITARRIERLEKLAEEIREMGRRAVPIRCDVTVDGDLEKAVEKVHAELGTIDISIANAGFGVAAPLEKLTLEDYRRQFETNVFGVLRTIYATLPDLKEKKGNLVLMGSVAGHISVPGASPYSMSKFAIRALSDSLYHELRPKGVAVTLISPGYVVSEIHQVDNQGRYNPNMKIKNPQWLMMPTDKAAKKMANAIAARKREQVITGHGKLAVLASRLSPGLFHFLVRLASRSITEKADRSE